MDAKISFISNPVITIGILYFKAKFLNCFSPIIVATWPGHKNASTFKFGFKTKLSIACGIVFKLFKMEKFLIFLLCAISILNAIIGAVVSNPIAKKTTSLLGLSSAIFILSKGE